MKKRLLSILLSACLVLTLLPGTAMGAETSTAGKLAMAKALNSLGLFQGYDTTGENFGLGDVATREQALIFQIRALGEDTPARNWKGNSPYSDVAASSWALIYVGYAAQKGYTQGTGGGRFGLGQLSDARMMATFILRGMGYSDGGSSPDFTFNTSLTFAATLGIADSGAAFNSFTRGDAAAMLYRALSAKCKDGRTLAQRLIAQGVFTQAQYEAAQKIAASAVSAPTTLTPLRTGNTPANSNNHGLAVTDGNYIYYSVPASKRIDRMNLDGTDVVTVLSSVSAQCLNIMDGWLYYSDNTNRCISKVKLDGTGAATVKAGVWPAYMQVTADGWIYFQNRNDDRKLCRVTTAGTSYDTVTETATGDFFLFQNYIVVEVEGDGSKLYWISSQDFTQYGKISDLNCDSMDYFNGRFYFANGNDGRKYYSILPDGTGLSKVRNWYTGAAMFAPSGKLFFTGGNSSDRTQCKLYTQNLTSTADATLISGSNTAYYISIVGNYVIYATKFDYAFYKTTGTISTPMRMVKLDGSADKAAPTPSGKITDKVAPTSVSLDRTTLSLTVGQSYDLTATLTPLNAKISLTWSSSNSTVASVSSTGVITAKKPGTATITVKSYNGLTAVCKVTVTAAAATTTANFELVNQTGSTITALYMTTADTTDWGANLLPQNGQLSNNGSVTLSIPFSKTTKYDLLAKYSNGSQGDFRGLSFANATSDGGVLLLKNSVVTLYPQITVPVTFVNLTGQSFTAMYASSSQVDDWGSTLGSLVKDGSIKINFPMTAFDTVFDIKANYSGGSYEFTGMDFGSLPTSGATIYLYLSGNVPAMSTTKPTTPTTRNVDVTFVNNTSMSFTALYSTDSGSATWGTDNLLKNVSGTSIIVSFPVSSSVYLYDLKFVNANGTEFELRNLDFSQVGSTATLELTESNGSLVLTQLK